MRITIDSSVLQEDGFTMQDFAVVLYYMSGGSGILNNDICEELWERGFLKKVLDGYQFHEGKRAKIRTWLVKSKAPKKELERLTNLAKALQNEFPEGKKDSKYYWRDSTKIIAQRLAMFIERYGDYSDEDFIAATRAYVSSYNGNYAYMQLLKYFIYKKDKATGDENSQLSSYLDNLNSESPQERDWTTNLV